MTRQHAVFVYGTLRPGQRNYERLLAGRTVQVSPAIAKGLALYGHRFPYAVTQSGARTVGDLITIKPSLYREVLADLDQLEGYQPNRPESSHYIRSTRSIVATVSTPNGGTWEAFHTAWIYLAGPDIDPTRMPRITDDDCTAGRCPAWPAPTRPCENRPLAGGVSAPRSAPSAPTCPKATRCTAT
jgi:gamma-glutamylcyclotransferase (GGCT)/AIG2-like uncharacterized protein YtfP